MGGALIGDGERSEYGDVPPAEQLDALVEWLDAEGKSFVATRQLSELWSGISGESGPAGLLAFRWSASSWLLLFRNEIVRSVFWAGDPNKPVERDTDGRLSPRGSFEAWKQDVRGQARPWQNAEIDALRPLRRLSVAQEIASARAVDEVGAGHVNSRDPVFIVDLDGVILDWNHAAEQRLGMSDLEGTKLISMLPFVAPASLTSLLKDASQGDVWTGEYSTTGDAGLFEVVVFPVQLEEASAHRVGVAMRDVAENRLLEKQLRHAQKMEALGQLSGGMAHNFNNLLTVILNSAELGLRHLRPEHPSYAEFQSVQRAGLSATRIVRDLLSFASERPITSSAIDLAALVRDLEAMLQHLLRRGVRLEIDAAIDDAFAVADRNQVEQVLINLITNARNAIDGEGLISVRVFCEYLDDDRAGTLSMPSGNHVVINVADSGRGIDAELMDRIFDPFFTTVSGGEGTGLGLASSASIVKACGGAIRVHSQVGVGSQFMVYFPRVAPPRSAQVEPLPGQTILVVDDDEGVARSLDALLTARGYIVRVTGSAHDALAVLETPGTRIDLLMTDQTMPDMDGLTLIRTVGERVSRIPAILMSGAPIKIDPEEFPDVTFVPKPFSPQELLEAVADAVDAG